MVSIVQETFNKILKSYFDNDTLRTVGDCYHEWKIEDWNKISKEEEIIDSEFTSYYAQNIKWQLKLYPQGLERNNWEYVVLSLASSLNVNPKFKNDYSIHIPVHIVYYIRNYNDYSCYHCEELPIQYFTPNHNEYLMGTLIKKSELFNKVKNSNSSLITNNKCVFGVYFRIYKYDKDCFKNELASYLFDETEEKIVKVETFYEWKIYNWSELYKYECKLSQEFSLYGHKWKLALYPNGDDKESEDYVSLYLACCDPDKDKIHAKFTLSIRNFDDPECCFADNCDAIYDEESFCWGMSKFIDRKRLLLKNNHLKKKIIEKNKCVIAVYIQIFEEKLTSDDIDLLINLMKLNNAISKTKNKIEELEKLEDKQEEKENIKRELRGEIESELIEKLESELREEIE